MENYEIRILRLDGSPALITEQKYLNANAAITAAKLLAGGRPVGRPENVRFRRAAINAVILVPNLEAPPARQQLGGGNGGIGV